MSEERGTIREIEHTADLGLEIEGADLPSLFSYAGEAFYRLIADPTGIELKEEISVVATGEGWEELFHAWLCELLALFNLKGFIGRRCEVESIEHGRVQGRVKGEALDLKRHHFRTEIKGVTYHGFGVSHESGKWRARVIFDV